MNTEESGKGLLVMISGPSGGGKDTVVKKFRTRHPEFNFLVTSTTRPIRTSAEGKPIEIHGVDYLFETKAEFEKGIIDGDFVEFANVYGQLKGLRKSQILRVNREERMILRVDPVATAYYADNLKARTPEIAVKIIDRMVKVYIGVTDLWTLGSRRIEREGRDGWQEYLSRVKQDWEDWQKIKGLYEGEVVINRSGGLEETVIQVEEIIRRKFGEF